MKLTIDQEQEIIAYYLKPSSLQETARYFLYLNDDRRKVKRILEKYNICFHDKETLEKIKVKNQKKTFIEHFGVENPSQIQWIKDKKKQTCKNNFGVDCGFLIKEKTKATCLKKYGVEYAAQAESVKAKAKETSLKNWGVCHPQSAEQIKEKIRLNWQNKPEDKIKESTNKAKETLKQRYGVEHPPKRLYCFDNIYFDSFPELALYLYAKENNEEIKRSPCTLKYTINGIEHDYLPDFLYNGQLVEIKGKQFLKEDGTWQNPFDHSLDDVAEARHQCALKNNVKILYEDEYLKYVQWFYNKGYTKKSFIYKNKDNF